METDEIYKRNSNKSRYIHTYTQTQIGRSITNLKTLDTQTSKVVSPLKTSIKKVITGWEKQKYESNTNTTNGCNDVSSTVEIKNLPNTHTHTQRETEVKTYQNKDTEVKWLWKKTSPIRRCLEYIIIKIKFIKKYTSSK